MSVLFAFKGCYSPWLDWVGTYVHVLVRMPDAKAAAARHTDCEEVKIDKSQDKALVIAQYLSGWPGAMSCHVMASRAMPGHIFVCRAIVLRVMPCHEYSVSCRVRIFLEK